MYNPICSFNSLKWNGQSQQHQNTDDKNDPCYGLMVSNALGKKKRCINHRLAELHNKRKQTLTTWTCSGQWQLLCDRLSSQCLPSFNFSASSMKLVSTHSHTSTRRKKSTLMQISLHPVYPGTSTMYPGHLSGRILGVLQLERTLPPSTNPNRETLTLGPSSTAYEPRQKPHEPNKVCTTPKQSPKVKF